MRKILIVPVIVIAGIFFNRCATTAPCLQEFSSVNDIVTDTKSRIDLISVNDLSKIQDDGEMFILIDVRTLEEHNPGYIPGSVLIPRGKLEFSIDNESFWEEEGMYAPLKDEKLIIYCRSGNRSALATESLMRLGYKNVYSLDGGFVSWKSDFPELIESNLPPVSASAQPMIAAEEDAGGC